VALLAARVATAQEEVTVHGARHEPGETSLTAAEIRQVPGAFGDAFRAIDALPGGAPINSGIPYLFLRGAPPGNSGYFIDGIRVPLLYHVAFGPSVIAPRLIDRVDYYPGGAPAQFGRLVGGAVSADLARPAERVHADGTVRAFDAGALVESPLAGGRGDALVAGRYSYTAAALSLFSKGITLGYWDYQGRFGWKLGDRDRVGVFTFGSHDLRSELPGVLPTTFNADFHRIDVRYDHDLSRGTLRVALTLGVDTSGNEQGSASDRLAAVRVEIDRPITPTLRVRLGADATIDHFDAGLPATPDQSYAIAATYPAHEDTTTGAYADLVWRPAHGVEVVPGVRADLYEWHRLSALPLPPGPPISRAVALRQPAPFSAAAALDPRLSARVTLHPRVALVSTIGMYHQGPSFIIPVPGVQPGGFPKGLQAALQRSAGLEVALPAEITATVTGFWNEYRNVTDFSTCSLQFGELDVGSGCVDARNRGRAYGMELLVKRPLTNRLGGWLSYTLSRAVGEITTQAAFGSVPTRPLVPTQFDREHVLSMVAVYDFGRGWRAGARLFLMSGQPYYVYSLYGVEVGSLAPPPVVVGPYEVDRFPAFYRLDIRAEKRWPIGKAGWIAFVVEGLNVTLSREAVNVSCPYSGSCTPVMNDPLTIPSIGVEGSL
jgi:hypothetical protein